jgi:hypothetical protein
MIDDERGDERDHAESDSPARRASTEYAQSVPGHEADVEPGSETDAERARQVAASHQHSRASTQHVTPPLDHDDLADDQSGP